MVCVLSPVMDSISEDIFTGTIARVGITTTIFSVTTRQWQRAQAPKEAMAAPTINKNKGNTTTAITTETATTNNHNHHNQLSLHFLVPTKFSIS
jgi:cobalamin biosynthesis protein CobT